jgi:hypothetical protein
MREGETGHVAAPRDRMANRALSGTGEEQQNPLGDEPFYPRARHAPLMEESVREADAERRRGVP